MTFGRNHIYTFDKRFFSIPSLTRPQCQYLVARDFQDGNFTIVAASDSIRIITKDALLRIYRDGRVRSQGIRMHTVLDSQVYEELPVMFERTTVIRDGAFIKVNGEVNVECDMEHFVCSYIVSGFYHNRTAGMQVKLHRLQITEAIIPVAVLNTGQKINTPLPVTQPY